MVRAGDRIAGRDCAFGLVWHIWWLAIFGLVAIWAAVIGHSFVRDTRRTIVGGGGRRRRDRRWLMAAAAHRLSRVNSRRRQIIMGSRN